MRCPLSKAFSKIKAMSTMIRNHAMTMIRKMQVISNQPTAAMFHVKYAFHLTYLHKLSQMIGSEFKQETLYHGNALLLLRWLMQYYKNILSRDCVFVLD